MSDDLVKRLETLLTAEILILTMDKRIEELEGQLQSVLDRETSILRYYDAKLDAAEAKLAKAIEALDEAIYLLDPEEEDITKETGLYRIVKSFKELKGEQP
jgi:hypothetical protein